MDETCELVADFHEAFGCYTPDPPDRPTLPRLDAKELEKLHVVGKVVMDRVAKICYVEAEKRKDDPERQILWTRLQLIQEELAELARAFGEADLVGALDALCDLQYVVDGTFLCLGLGYVKLDAVREVHRSNMTKLGEDGRPVINEAGRVVKGPNYQPPQLGRFLQWTR